MNVLQSWPARRKSRALALMYLYSREMNETSSVQDVDSIAELCNIHEKRIVQRALELIQKVQGNRNKYSELLQKLARRWKTERISPVTRNIIFLGFVELLEEHEDVSMVINEAVELAKTYAEGDAYRFVHGILDQAQDFIKRSIV